MRGALTLRSSFELPPGEEDVPERLRLKGSFTIKGGQFTSDTVQEKVDSLSRRGQGQPTNAEVQNVLSTFGGAFSLGDGVLQLPRFQFSVRGSTVDLSGTYRLKSETMNFAGTLALDAPLSKTTTGFKSLLLRAVDPLFRRGGAGTLVPIKIAGSVEKPEFGVDVPKGSTVRSEFRIQKRRPQLWPSRFTPCRRFGAFCLSAASAVVNCIDHRCDIPDAVLAVHDGGSLAGNESSSSASTRLESRLRWAAGRTNFWIAAATAARNRNREIIFTIGHVLQGRFSSVGSEPSDFTSSSFGRRGIGVGSGATVLSSAAAGTTGDRPLPAGISGPRTCWSGRLSFL